MLTESSLSELRQVVRKVIGNTEFSSNAQIISCANTYFPHCDFIPLAIELRGFGETCKNPWKIVRWKFMQKRQDPSVFSLRYKNNDIINVRSGGKNIQVIQRRMLFQRRFTWENNQLVANHDYLVLPKKLQDNDMSKILNRIMYEFYKKVGVKLVKVYAGFEAGGYVWATAGFSATRKSEVYAILTLNRKRVARGETKDLSFALIDEFQELADDHYAKAGDEYFVMYDWAVRPGGKELLLGTDWHGEINLANPEQCVIFERYLNRRRK